jgi:hypothetical protein
MRWNGRLTVFGQAAYFPAVHYMLGESNNISTRLFVMHRADN